MHRHSLPDDPPDTLEDDPLKLDLDGFHLICTSCGAPEQYDVFKDNLQVGYLRLRHGRFTVEYPACGGELIFEANPEGDGGFMPYEQDEYLKKAMAAISERLKKGD